MLQDALFAFSTNLLTCFWQWISIACNIRYKLCIALYSLTIYQHKTVLYHVLCRFKLWQDSCSHRLYSWPGGVRHALHQAAKVLIVSLSGNRAGKLLAEYNLGAMEA